MKTSSAPQASAGTLIDWPWTPTFRSEKTPRGKHEPPKAAIVGTGNARVTFVATSRSGIPMFETTSRAMASWDFGSAADNPMQAMLFCGNSMCTSLATKELHVHTPDRIGSAAAPGLQRPGSEALWQRAPVDAAGEGHDVEPMLTPTPGLSRGNSAAKVGVRQAGRQADTQTGRPAAERERRSSRRGAASVYQRGGTHARVAARALASRPIRSG